MIAYRDLIVNVTSQMECTTFLQPVVLLGPNLLSERETIASKINTTIGLTAARATRLQELLRVKGVTENCCEVDVAVSLVC